MKHANKFALPLFLLTSLSLSSTLALAAEPNSEYCKNNTCSYGIPNNAMAKFNGDLGIDSLKSTNAFTNNNTETPSAIYLITNADTNADSTQKTVLPSMITEKTANTNINNLLSQSFATPHANAKSDYSSTLGLVRLRGVNMGVKRWVIQNADGSHTEHVKAYLDPTTNNSRGIYGRMLTSDGATSFLMNAILAASTDQTTIKSINLNAPLGSTDNSWQQLEKTIKGTDGANEFNKTLAQSWVSLTATDPVAGNPDSFVARMTDNNYAMVSGNIYDNNLAEKQLFSANPSFTRSETTGTVTQQLNLPLSYSYALDKDSNLTIMAPINYAKIGDSTSYDGALSVGYDHFFYRSPVFSWSVTPSLGFGVLSSNDLIAATGLLNLGAASQLAITNKDWTIGINNDLSYTQTMRMKLGDVESNYDLKNISTKNGFSVIKKLNSPYAVGGYVNRMDVLSGTDWYINSVNEIGASVARYNQNKQSFYHNLTASLGYRFGIHDYKGFNLSAGVLF